MSPASPRRRTAPATAFSSRVGACTRARTSLLVRADCWSPSSSKKAGRPARLRSRAALPGHTPLFGLDSGCAHHFRVFFELGLDERSEFNGLSLSTLRQENG